jgi:hypothetical protein
MIFMGKCYKIYFLETTETSQECSLDGHLETTENPDWSKTKFTFWVIWQENCYKFFFFFAIISALGNPEAAIKFFYGIILFYFLRNFRKSSVKQLVKRNSSMWSQILLLYSILTFIPVLIGFYIFNICNVLF